jgi:hypothetical protein
LFDQAAGDFLGQLQRDFRVGGAGGGQQGQGECAGNAVWQTERNAARGARGRLGDGRACIGDLLQDGLGMP